MTDDRERWALILGGSSGMGEATALALARNGYRIIGIHLDFRAALAHVEEVKAGDRGRRQRGALHQHERRRRREAGGGDRDDPRPVRRRAARPAAIRTSAIVMHSLAFGSLVPFIADDPKEAVDRKKMEMTQDVMANSLVYWVQDLYRAGFLEKGSKVYAMTSEGTSRVIPSYGVVSGAKAAMESHVRQLAMEFARRGDGIAVNSIRAGVTDTPALRKIPENQRMVDITLARNPHGRLTTTQDVAEAIVRLSARPTPTGSAATSSASTVANSSRADRGQSVSGRVIVVGSVNVDLVAHAERLPAAGETVTGATFSEHDGGKGANQAVAAARLGASTAFVGAVGRRRVRDAGAGGARPRGHRPDRAHDRRRPDRRRADPRRRGRREHDRGRVGGERRADPERRRDGARRPRPGGRRRRPRRPRDPDDLRAPRPEAGPRGRRDRRLQPGAGDRHRPLGVRPRRRPDRQPPRAGGDRRRRRPPVSAGPRARSTGRSRPPGRSSSGTPTASASLRPSS